MPLTALEPGKLYRQRLNVNDQYRTVLCVKYESWRIYKKITFIVGGQPQSPTQQVIVDKFSLADYLEYFEEIPDET